MTHRHDGFGAESLDPALLDAYLANRCTVADHARVTQWIAEVPGRGALLEGMRRGIALPSYDVTLPSMERTQAALRSRIAMDTDRASVKRTVASQTRWRSMVVGAAMCGVVVGVFALVRGWSHTSSVRSQRTYSTRVNEYAQLTLDDGSHVTIAPQSTMRVVVADDHSRTVSLIGAAYFDIRAASSAPFVVVSGGAATRVLGTGFLVRHYASDRTVRVSVASGKVTVRGANRAQPLVLPAGYVGTITDSDAVAMSMTGTSPHVGWADDQIIFRNAPAPEMLTLLSQWYGYEFQLSDSMLSRLHFTAGISTVSLAEALSTLKILMDVDYKFEGNVITLTPRQGKKAPSSPRELFDNLQTREVGR